ncbi:hypothetical protein PVAP13_9KG018822 [Panicum virgatum]|uniref:Cytochrome b6-f complex subunit 7 n=2 Tax=Panicum virgatum TaxID=38727 RepID=A0A8T0NBK9_PANVG|nr:hypothetical protein PVAP13_9KG018822 [Panicum virgatum]
MPHSSHPLQHRDPHLLLRCRRGAGSSPPSAGMASFAVATIPSLAAPAARKRSGGVTYVEGMNAYSGLKGLNKVTMLGLRKTADYSFAKIVASLSPAGKARRGSAFGAQMNAAAEIFRIAAIMNGLVLVGVAVGFVLLRVEAAVEEAE